MAHHYYVVMVLMVTSAFSPYNYVALQYRKINMDTCWYSLLRNEVDPTACASWREGPRLFWQVRGGVSGVRGV